MTSLGGDAPSFDEVWLRVSEVPGWLSKAQGLALFDAAANVPVPNHIVEIGSHLGRSTILLALGAQPGVTVHAVDPFDDRRWGGGEDLLKRFQANLVAAGVRDRVDYFRGRSSEASAKWISGPVGLVWVDGAHDRESVLADIDGWTPHLVTNGRMYFHDAYSSPGVTFAIFYRLFGREWRYLGSRRSLAMFQKSRPSWVSMFRMISRLGYFARNVTIKVGSRRGQNWVGPLLGWHEKNSPY